MLVHPNFDPVALSLGPVHIHWYGLMYLIGFYGCWFLAIRRGKSAHMPFSAPAVSDLLFFTALGVILGGRIGYTLFYNLPTFLKDPVEIFRIWKGGMSFHGGLLGVIAAVWLFARTRKLTFFYVMDFVALVVPFGLLTGRIGNFINAELWGKASSLPWAMVFPTDPDRLPRHPSMLYEAFLEGFVMLVILWWFSSRPRPPASVCGLFLILYGTFRSLIEFVRVPDAQIGYLAGGWLTMGQVLCLPMLLTGTFLMVWAYRRPARA
ncbi:prolipoprotein diacylglyceryl transferase [Panacagrimonas perspica]|uniref:Phosphatidylglycerol--prolipoprotein diacylglyceryl transferase n=1 Tax=Panacagrimonas perspica TaxID=381431 RepID=A0A4R7NT95_9GAMM|nr:prolipoprotein diacylglyceryl transferase [Panacagrimonas perspica]TDU24304.1 prolipoprotein diacylglyceryl transferase [Panacagrimonas perspica]THD04704.1 prolipoprotein diacylglyceryl transferase [Panacagrimonas perspica]